MGIEGLLVSPETTDEEANAQAEQEVGEYGSNDGCFDDRDQPIICRIILANQDHEEHDFNDAAEKGFEDDA